MEKGGDISSSGFSVLDKKSSSSNSDFVSSIKSSEAFHHQGSYNLGRPFVGDDEDDDDGGGVRVGPTGGDNEVLGDIYRHDFSSSVGGGGIFVNKTATTPNFQSFNIFPSSYSTIPYKSPGGGMGFPFTASQWKELERQAMIYKCMISSVPVPPYLLLPLSTNFSATSLSTSAVYSGRYSKNGDPEPGRCKRTDGKKWRCAKEVAPQQKYCERHLHRGRPRSRKPVEPKNNGQDTYKKTRLQHTKTDLTISTPYCKPTTRDLGEAEMEQPWENLMEPNMGLANCYFPQDYMEQTPVFSYPNFPTPEIDLPTRFIDNLNARNSSITNMKQVNEGDLSPSLNLSMAMAAGNDCPVSWGGGPLGEALQPGSMASNPASPYNSMSTPATSPSGVLHWTLFSHSDSSVCNSPTLVAPPSEASNQWQN